MSSPAPAQPQGLQLTKEESIAFLQAQIVDVDKRALSAWRQSRAKIASINAQIVALQAATPPADEPPVE